MALALEARAMKDDIMLGDTPKALKRRRKLKDVQSRGRLWKHSTLSDIDGLLTPSELQPLFAFTTVRNPWDRMVSYYHWLRAQSFDHPATALAKQVDFHSFAQSGLIISSMQASSAQHYMTNAAGAERCNAYIRIEHFEQDAQPLFDHLGFALTLEKVNTSARGSNYQDYYDDKTREAVRIACQTDIEKFDYSFA